MMSNCKSFVSETELAERRRRRQEEWEKVRKPEDPLDVPEEEYDPRSLYERLKEQKDQKQAEYEEAHRLKNMIRGLDDDEVEFLDLVDRTKEEIEAQRWKEETKELQEFRKAVANLAEKKAEQRLLELKEEVKVHLASSPTVKKSQSSLLANVVKRKCSEPDIVEKKSKTDNKISDTNVEKNSTMVTKSTTLLSDEENIKVPSSETELNGNLDSEPQNEMESQVCIGVLPGLGVYSDSSDSDNSSASDVEDKEIFDLVGRRRIPKSAYDALMKILSQKKMKQQFQHCHWS